ncbi:MAG: WD40 repeat domain-containing protein [Promethearchaeota archaeon]
MNIGFLLDHKIKIMILLVIVSGSLSIVSAIVGMELGSDDSTQTMSFNIRGEGYAYLDPALKPVLAPNGQFLVTTDGAGYKIWDTTSWSLLTSSSGHNRSNVVAVISANSLYVAIGYEGGCMLYRTDDWTLLSEQTSDYTYTDVFFSPNNQFLYIKYSRFERVADQIVSYYSHQILNTSTGFIIKEIGGEFSDIAFSFDGAYLALRNTTHWQILNTTNWSIILNREGHNPYYYAKAFMFSPNSDYFVLSDNQNLTVYNTNNWEIELTMPITLSDVEFSPDGRYLGIYGVSDTRKLVLWDTITQTEEKLQPYDDFNASDDAHGHITFSPSGNYLLWYTYTLGLDFLGEEERIDDTKIVLLRIEDKKLIYQSFNLLYDEHFSPNDDYVLLMEYDSFVNYILYGDRIRIIRTEDGVITRFLNTNFGGIYSVRESIVGVTEDYVICSGIAYNFENQDLVVKIWNKWQEFDPQDVVAPLLIGLAIVSGIGLVCFTVMLIILFIHSIIRKNQLKAEIPKS